MSDEQRDGRKEDDQAEEKQGEDQRVATMGSPAEAAVAELAGLVKTLLIAQSARDEKIEQEMARQEQRWKSVQHQFQQLQGQVGDLREGSEAARSRPTTPSPSAERSVMTRMKEPKLHPLTKEDDVEHFLTTFERMAAVCQWPEETWSIRLVPLLTGKARSAFVAMDSDDTEDYKKVKEAILKKYDINEETYRQRFRATDILPGESPKELYVRLKELFSKWIKPEQSTVHEISEVIIMEQFMRMMSMEMQVWIKEHDPKTAEEAARLAEVYLTARQGPRGANVSRWSPEPKMKSYGSGDNQAFRQSRPNTYRPPDRARQDLQCFNCGRKGHTKPYCRAKKTQESALCHVPRPNVLQTANTDVTGNMVQVLVNGQVSKALVDTGSTQTLVLEKLVPEVELFSQGKVKVCCVHGDTRDYPTTEVYLTVSGQTFMMEVAVAPHLPHDVILGQDLPILSDLLPRPQSCSVVTRAQAAKMDLQALPFADEDLEVRRPRRGRLSRREKRTEKIRGTVASRHSEMMPEPEGPVTWAIPQDIAEMQKNDETLKSWFEKVTEVDGVQQGWVSSLAEEKYVVKNGILYQRKGDVEALAVPASCRFKVMDLAHSVPWAGHLGKHKTLARIASRFSWPMMYTDVTDFIRTCTECQLTAGRKVAPALLNPLPVIDTPFTRMAMDIVGPLERSKRGYRYILVVCDYATKYPEAFPLKAIKARQVADCLVQLFSRVGLPREVITDQGTNFLSLLLKQVYQLLGIKGIRTTPYHPQTDGLVERFNQTLKNMLRRFVSQTGADWDQWLPYLLFAYREVPQASTGFSPFELLYGRQVRGPLDLLREQWEGPSDGKRSVVQYVVEMRQRLEEMTALAQENMQKAQRNQKTWYDRKARERSFEPGQKVLLLLPSQDSKLLAKWQGPYEVQRKTGRVTYQILMPERKNKSQNFHVNLLKEFHPREEKIVSQLFVRAVREEEETEEQYFPVQRASQAVDLGHLDADQRGQMDRLLDPDLFQEKPGLTRIVEHDIVFKQETSPKQKSYRIPERMLGVLKQELDTMLSMGIIEPSASEWCSPVVLVPKKDGTVRFCIDFRQVNALTKTDPYPMPRIDELVERLGKAKYITTVDLCKGYWQVAMAQSAKELTAFRTPYGLYHFRVMPFGLQGAPGSFQRLMDQVLRDTSDFAAAYLDDVVIFSETWTDHCDHLQEIFRRIKEAGLTINPQKCMLARREVSYLGFIIGDGVIRPQLEKVEAIRSFTLPATKKKVRSFLGLVGWYRRFIPNFSSRAAVLTDLTKAAASNKVVWTEQSMQAFQDLKEAVCGDSVLLSPDFERPFILQTDASGIGLGAVLLQEVDGARRPVAFLSRKLCPRERRYSAVELECLAIKWALDSLRYYLLGRHFTLETDHRALQWLNRMRDANSRITRWYLSLQPYEFTVHYRPGATNKVADFLSRIPEDE